VAALELKPDFQFKSPLRLDGASRRPLKSVRFYLGSYCGDKSKLPAAWHDVPAKFYRGGTHIFFLMPREVSSDWATMWVACVDEALTAEEPILVGGSPHQDASPWESWPGGIAMARVRHREIRITGLQPRQRYDLQLLFKGRSVAHADVTTLPTAMPALGEKPFTVLLGSCFSHRQDPGGKVGKTFAALPSMARPDVKLLAGDQVYLDDPWYKFFLSFSHEELRASFMEAYLGTWGQGRRAGDGQGFAQLLASGANYFSSDDHEFWNNAPNFVAFARNT
jgi:hypothetical protein